MDNYISLMDNAQHEHFHNGFDSGNRNIIIPMMEITLGKCSTNISTMGLVMVLGVLLFP